MEESKSRNINISKSLFIIFFFIILQHYVYTTIDVNFTFNAVHSLIINENKRL